MGKTYIGTSKLNKLFLGTTKVKKIYLGTDCVFTCGFVFTYSGNCTLNGTACTPNTEYTVESGSFNIIFTSSGTLTISSLGDYTAFDSFLCGAGNDGATGEEHSVSGSEHDWYGGDGGNGGKYYTSSNFALTEGNTYSIVVGASSGADSSGFGHSSSEFSGTVAQGGLGGRVEAHDWASWVPSVTVQATAGANGVYPFDDSSFGYYGSSGGGGQGYGAISGSSASSGPTSGGSYAGAGGAIGYAGGNATANRGAGGGGGSSGNGTYSGGSGSSGAVILRNHS